MIGPDYLRPQAPTAPDWIESDSDGLQRTEADTRAWWTVFGDPVLDSLVEAAYRQNPTLRSAGSRVLRLRGAGSRSARSSRSSRRPSPPTSA